MESLDPDREGPLLDPLWFNPDGCLVTGAGSGFTDDLAPLGELVKLWPSLGLLEFMFLSGGPFLATGLVLEELFRTPGIWIIVLPREIEGTLVCCGCFKLETSELERAFPVIILLYTFFPPLIPLLSDSAFLDSSVLFSPGLIILGPLLLVKGFSSWSGVR